MSLILLASVLLFSQSEPSPDAVVTFANVAQPAAEAISGLSIAAGVPLMASATVKPSILLINADHRPLKDVMARIAEAVGGSWEDTDALMEGPAVQRLGNAVLAKITPEMPDGSLQQPHRRRDSVPLNRRRA